MIDQSDGLICLFILLKIWINRRNDNYYKYCSMLRQVDILSCNNMTDNSVQTVFFRHINFHAQRSAVEVRDGQAHKDSIIIGITIAGPVTIIDSSNDTAMLSRPSSRHKIKLRVVLAYLLYSMTSRKEILFLILHLLNVILKISFSDVLI